jgi:hypothetical protein
MSIQVCVKIRMRPVEDIRKRAGRKREEEHGKRHRGFE